MSQICMYKVFRYSVALAFICMAGQTIRNRKLDKLTSKTIRYNGIKADVGEQFFREFIYDDNAFQNVNEQTICSLIHFFIREASQNGKFVPFSSGTFVVYDSTGRLFSQLMKAKNRQKHSNEHRSGYVLRLKHFFMDLLKNIVKFFLRNSSEDETPFIYLRGDESSHFHERGNRHVRWNVYPAYGIDFSNDCLPNKFLHLLFGQLKGLTQNGTEIADRIYFKPEHFGLQQFSHYVAHTIDFIKTFAHLTFCQWIDRWNFEFCHADDVFHEWTDRRWIKAWTQILFSIKSLTFDQKRHFQSQAVSNGISEIYQQISLFQKIPDVIRFENELRLRYGNDLILRRGNEIIFTTQQLLKQSSSFNPDSTDKNDQCRSTNDEL